MPGGNVMAGSRGLKAFRSEVDALRNVIKRAVNDAVRRRLGDMEELKKRQELLEKSLRRGPGKGLAGKDMKMLEGMVESRLGGLNNKILMLRREMEMLRSELESSSVKRLQEGFHRDVSNIKSQLNKVIIDGRGLEERISSEMEELKSGMEAPKPGGPGINVEELKRDLEIIKTKQEWIENNIERIDIKPLLMKMEELEHRIRVMRVSSPIVLE